jgi:two-component system, LuxR family, sensor kinase FixL
LEREQSFPPLGVHRDPNRSAMSDSLPAARRKSRFLPALAGLLAIAIFFVDTIVPLDIAIAVLYVVVVLIASNIYQRRGLLVAGAACMGLTLLSYFIVHVPEADSALVRCLMSLAAIGATTLLALRNQAANIMLRERARLLDLTHDTIFARNMNDTITYWNLGAEQLYGWRADEAIGKNSHQLMKTVFPEPLESINAELVRAGRWEGELLHTKRDGTSVKVASRWSLQKDDRNRLIGTLETNNDITERSRAQEALQVAQAELAHVSRLTTLGELMASIAHEVNQPLAGVVTNGEACLRWLNFDPPELGEVRSGLESMISDGVRASEVIWGLRTLTKKTQSQRTTLNINESVEQVTKLVQRELLDNRVSLQLDLSHALPNVFGDRVQLQQVVLNLIINGIQAMSTINDHRRILRVQSRQNQAGEVVVAVIDSGTGIDPAMADQLFRAFFTTKTSGLGMGLSICRSIIEAHGGKVIARNNQGPGATFQFTLPADIAANG